MSEEIDGDEIDFFSFTREQLLDFANEYGIKIEKALSKSEIVILIRKSLRKKECHTVPIKT